jgi:hypothetical protein
LLLLLPALALSGCVSKSTAQAEARKAYLEGQHRAIANQEEAQNPAVWFRGPVRNPRVPWSEDLTLTRALLAAEYLYQLSPMRISVIRQGKTYSIDVRRMLRGQEDPPMEPGDIVEVVR